MERMGGRNKVGVGRGLSLRTKQIMFKKNILIMFKVRSNSSRTKEMKIRTELTKWSKILNK